MAGTSMPIWGVLNVFAADGEKFTKVVLNCAEYSIGSDRNATIIVRRHNVDPIHCIVEIQSNGLALLKNKSEINPVPINERPVPKMMYLLPGDSFTVVGKKFLYKNDHLKPEVIQEAKRKNMESIRKMKRPTMGRKLLTPQPEKVKVYKARRSASMDNLAKTPEKGKKTFTVSTPKSAVKPTAPSLRNAAIFKNLAEMNFTEPECDNSSTNGGDRSEVLKTPVAEILNEDNDVSTPLNNTSVVSIAMPVEDEVTPLRSRKSKAKDISIQRLTQNDESVIVLDTPDSKTPKSALKATLEKGSFANINKTKLIDEYSDCESPKNDDETNDDEIDDSVMDSSVKEVEEVEADSSVNESVVTESSDDLKPTRKACSSFLIEDKHDSDDLTTKIDCGDFVVETASETETESENKAPASSTPAQKNKSTKKLVESFKQIEDVEEIVEEEEEEEETEMDASSSEMDQTTSTDYDYREKRKRGRYTSTEENSMKRLKFAGSEDATEIESEISLDESLTKTPQPAKLPARKAMTEPKQTKKIIHRRSLSDRISNQENEPVIESANTTCESVDTSSFVYLKNNVTFENSDFGSPVPQSEAKPDTGKKGQKEPLNDLTDVAGIKKLMQTPRAGKEPLNDLSSPTGVQRLMKTPKAQKDDADDHNMSGMKALMKTPAVERANSAEEDKSEEGTTSSVFNVSGISTLNDEDEDIFPKQKARRTYGKSLPVKSKDIAGGVSRKSEGCLAEISPEVEKWVAKNTENLSNHNITDIDYDAADDESPMEDSEVPAAVAKADENQTGRRNRGRSLPASNANKLNKKVRHTEGALPESIEENDDEDVEAVVSRKGIRKSVPDEDVMADEAKSDDDEHTAEEPVISSRKSIRKSLKEMETSTLDEDINECEAAEVEVSRPQSVVISWKTTRRSQANAKQRESVRKSSAKVESVDTDESVEEIDAVQEQVVSSRKSTRKSVNNEAIDETTDEIAANVSGNEKDEVVEEPVFPSRNSIRKSGGQTQSVDEFEIIESSDDEQTENTAVPSRKSVRKSLKNVEATDDDLEMLQEPHVSSSKHDRKSIKDVESSGTDESTIDDVADFNLALSCDETSYTQAETSQLDVSMERDLVEGSESEEAPEEPTISSRKSARKSMKETEAVDDDNDEVVEEPAASSRKSTRKSRMSLVQNEKPVDSPRKSVRRTTSQIETEHDKSTEEVIVEIPVAVSRQSSRKSLAKVESSENDGEDGSEQDIENAQQVGDTVEMETDETPEPVVSAKDSSRKSLAKPLDEPAPEELSSSKKTARKSLKNIDTIESGEDTAITEAPKSSRKSVRKSIKSMETPTVNIDDVNEFEEVANEPIASSRKSSRKSLAKTVDEHVSKEPLYQKKSALKSLKNIETFEDEENAVEDVLVEDSKSARKSIRKSLKLSETSIVDVDEEENEVEEIVDVPVASSRKSFRKTLSENDETVSEATTVSRKSVRKSIINDSIVETTPHAELPSATRKSVRKSISINEPTTPTQVSTSKSRKSASAVLNVTSDIFDDSDVEEAAKPGDTFITPVKATPSKDDTVFKTPQLLSKTPKSSKKSTKKRNVAETEVKSVDEDDESEAEIIAEEKPQEGRKPKRARIQKEPENDLSSPRGVKQLLATPKVVKGPKNDLSSPKGVKQLMATPKVAKEPKNDLSDTRGVKQLLATPKAVKEPKNDLSNLQGVKQLMATPKVVKGPKNDLSSPKGLKKLMRTPKQQKGPKNDLSDVEGVAELMATEEVEELQEDETVAPVKVEKSAKKNTRENKENPSARSSRSRKNAETVEETEAATISSRSSRNTAVVDNETPKVETKPKRGATSASATKSGRSLRNAPKESDEVVEKTPIQETKPKRGAISESATKSGRSRRNAPKEDDVVEETPKDQTKTKRVATSAAKNTAKRSKIDVVSDSEESAAEDTNMVNDTPKPTPKEMKPKATGGRKAKLDETEEKSSQEDTEDVADDETPVITKSTRTTKTTSEDKKPAATRKRGGKSVPELEENKDDEPEQDSDTKKAGRSKEPEQTVENPKSTRSRRGKAAVADSEATEAATNPEIEPIKARTTRKKTVEVETESVQEEQPAKNTSKTRRGQKSEPEIAAVKTSTRGRRGQKAVEVEDVTIDDEETGIEQPTEETKTGRGKKSEPEVVEAKTKTRGRRGRKAVEVDDEETDAQQTQEDKKTTEKQKSEAETVEAKTKTRGRRGQKAAEVEEVVLVDDETGDEQPPEENTTTGGKKSETEVVEAKTKTRSRRGRKAVEVEDEETDVEQPQEEKKTTRGKKPEPEVVEAKTKTRGRKAVEVEEVVQVHDEEADVEQPEEEKKTTRGRRGAAKAEAPKATTKASRGRATKAVEEEVEEPAETQEKPTRARRGRKATVEAEMEEATPKVTKGTRRGAAGKEEAVADEGSAKKATKAAPKRGRPAKDQKTTSPVIPAEEDEVEVEVVSTKRLKGVTTITVEKKVSFKDENKGGSLLTTPQPKVSKRRLKSDAEMNDSDLQPTAKRTRARK